MLVMTGCYSCGKLIGNRHWSIPQLMPTMALNILCQLESEQKSGIEKETASWNVRWEKYLQMLQRKSEEQETGLLLRNLN